MSTAPWVGRLLPASYAISPPTQDETAARMVSASTMPPNCRRGDLGQPVGLRVAARAQVDEPLVLAAGSGARVPDDRRRVGDGETSRRHLEHVRAAAVRPGNLARRDRRPVEANVERLVDPPAGRDRDLERDLRGVADLELEPGGYCATHGR